MAAPKRLYRVTDKKTGEQTYVRAIAPVSARNFVAKDTLLVDRVSADEMIELLSAGTSITINEAATEESEVAETTEE